MTIGDRYTTIWGVSHRVDAVITDCKHGHVWFNADHRCKPMCGLLREHAQTLILSGPRKMDERDFLVQFVLMNPDAIALGPAQ